MKKKFLLLFLLSFPLFAQDNAKKSVQEQTIDTSTNKTQEVDEKDTKKKKEKSHVQSGQFLHLLQIR